MPSNIGIPLTLSKAAAKEAIQMPPYAIAAADENSLSFI